MRGFRLNGWQRIGIVLSVLWAIAAGAYVWQGSRNLSYVYWRTYYHCVFTPGNDENSCQAAKEQAETVPSKYVSLLLPVALAAIPVAWLLVYIVVWTVRWVRRGFQLAA